MQDRTSVEMIGMKYDMTGMTELVIVGQAPNWQ